jgi:hypothetical protein
MSMTAKDHMQMMARIRQGLEPFPDKIKPKVKRAKNDNTINSTR